MNDGQQVRLVARVQPRVAEEEESCQKDVHHRSEDHIHLFAMTP